MKEKCSFYDFIFQPKHIVIGLKKNAQRIRLNFAKLIGWRFYVTQCW